jgi:hypothetical protein
MKIILLGALLSLVNNQSYAHDYWNNDKPVPAWVKSSCCGKIDAHYLRPDQVHRHDDYYIVDGYTKQIPVKQALPSQDGDYWIFYAGPECSEICTQQSSVYCFFVPMAF